MQEKPRILIVDDETTNIGVLFEALKDEYKINIAKDGKSAIDIAKSNLKPDLILLDVMMPDINGFEICKILKEDENTKNIPIIFVTILSQTDREKIGLELGAIDYIIKPIVPEIVKARVKNYIELKKMRDSLEQRVQEEIQKRVSQQELLVKQSRLAAMGEMLSVITHQWNQPITVIQMLSSMIEELSKGSMLDEKKINDINEYAQKIIQTTAFMLQTMNTFKNFFKPTKVQRRFSLKDEIDKILDILAPQMKTNNIKIDLGVDEKIKIFGTPNEFAQVILNIVVNAKDAIKTTKKSGGNIKIYAIEDDESVQISIEDNGGGVPEEIKDKIFESSFTTKGDSGSGIGLYMSKMIIEEIMNGKIWVENIDDGARFCIKLNKTK